MDKDCVDTAGLYTMLNNPNNSLQNLNKNGQRQHTNLKKKKIQYNNEYNTVDVLLILEL